LGEENLSDIKIVRATSSFDCGGRCPLKPHVKDNRIIRFEGDDHIKFGGLIFLLDSQMKYDIS